jgi:putative membrane protein
MKRRTYLSCLVGVFVAYWLALAIGPNARDTWLMENLLLFVGVAVLVASHRALPLSQMSYTMIFAFLALHATGAHYTYSLVPWAEWMNAIGLGRFPAVTAERNQFDRIVHFSYGLLLAYPIREVFLRVANLRGFWGYFFPLSVTLSTSVLYELMEWAVAEVLGGDLGMEFLGAQGDIWDAQKDMALAGLGATLAMLVTGALNYSLQRDFALEWVESLRVKSPLPLGEDELARLWRQRKTRRQDSR